MEKLKENQEPSYFIVFPTYLLDELSAKRCVLCGLLLSLSRKDGYAYIGNTTLSEIMHCSIQSLQKDLQYLEEHNYIERKIIRNDNGEIVMRKIYPTSLLIRGSIKNDMTPVENLTLPSYQKLDVYSNNSISIKDNNKEYTEEFDFVWNLYGKIGNKKSSCKAWNRLNVANRKLVVNHIPLYIENHKKHGKTAFVPHLSTYLNQNRWEDELPYSSEKKDKNLDINWN